MAKADQASVWLARIFLALFNLRWYAEYLYVYDPGCGLYRSQTRQWLKHHVQTFLADTLGPQALTTVGVWGVCEAVLNERFLDESVHPPFWIDGRKDANVFVTRKAILVLDDIAATGRPEVVPHSPDLFAVCGVPYCYEAGAGCPNWLRFLDWMTGGNRDEVRLLQEFCAWPFVARRLKLEKILWLVGEGANGKSTFLRVVRYVLGEQATSAVGMEAFGGGESFRLQPTLYKLANFCNDASVRRKASVAALNNYVSGDPFTINRKFREHLTVEPTTVCFFASNPPPLYDDASDAFWRRLLLVQCRQRLAETDIDPTLLDKLRAEAPGILNWMLAGIPALLDRGRFAIPESVRRNVAELKAQVNAARMFIAEKVEAGEAASHIDREQFMAVFDLWCKDNGCRPDDVTVVKAEMMRAFGAELKRLRRGDKVGTGRGRLRVWTGVRWRSDEGVEDLNPLTTIVRSQKSQLEDGERRVEGLKADAAHSDVLLRNQAGTIAGLRADIDRKSDTIAQLRQRLVRAGVGHGVQNDDCGIDPARGGDAVRDIDLVGGDADHHHHHNASAEIVGPVPPVTNEEVHALLRILEDDGPAARGVGP